MIVSLTLILTLYGLLYCLSSRRRLEDLVVLCVIAECCFCHNSYPEAGIECKLIFTPSDYSWYLRMHSDQEEYELVADAVVSTLTGSNNIATK